MLGHSRNGAMLKRIAHATDFSAQGATAFLHALALALACQARLDLLHVKKKGAESKWQSFPHVRDALSRWGLLAPDAAANDIEEKLGIRIAKIEIEGHDAREGLARFFLTHRPDLAVLATRARQGLDHWLQGSVSEEVVRETSVPALLFGPASSGFADAGTGTLRLSRALLAVTNELSPAHSFDIVHNLVAAVGTARTSIDVITVATDAPDILDVDGVVHKVERLGGEPVSTIVAEARTRGADLICLPTSGRHGMLEALKGSTTSRVLAETSCAVLSIPQIPVLNAKT